MNEIRYPEPPRPGWRWVNWDEKLEEGDEFFQDNFWKKTVEPGATANAINRYQRRLENIPRPGWRWLEVDETLKDGDEYNPKHEGWIKTQDVGMINRLSFYYQRRLETQEIAYDPVNHPQHYKSHPSGVECITITEHMNFCRGNAVKYIWRAGEKGNELEDLKKARWYLDREITRLEKQNNTK